MSKWKEKRTNIKNGDVPAWKKWCARCAEWGPGPDSSTIVNHWPKHMTLNKAAYLIKMYLLKTSRHCQGALIMSVLYLFLQDNKLHNNVMKEGNIIARFLRSCEEPLPQTSLELWTQRRTSSVFLGKSFAFRGQRMLWTGFPMQGIPWGPWWLEVGPYPLLAHLELAVDTGKGHPGGVGFVRFKTEHLWEQLLDCENVKRGTLLRPQRNNQPPWPGIELYS